jgi:hypothetical protein
MRIALALLPDPRVQAAACTSRVVLNEPVRAADGRTLWPSDHYGSWPTRTSLV